MRKKHSRHHTVWHIVRNLSKFCKVNLSYLLYITVTQWMLLESLKKKSIIQFKSNVWFKFINEFTIIHTRHIRQSHFICPQYKFCMCLFKTIIYLYFLCCFLIYNKKNNSYLCRICSYILYLIYVLLYIKIYYIFNIIYVTQKI